MTIGELISRLAKYDLGSDFVGQVDSDGDWSFYITGVDGKVHTDCGRPECDVCSVPCTIIKHGKAYCERHVPNETELQ